jgi:hypothetical protein
VTATGRFTRSRARAGRCKPRFYLTAKGTVRWTGRVPERLRGPRGRGRWQITSKAVATTPALNENTFNTATGNQRTIRLR